MALEPDNFLYHISRGNARYHLRNPQGVSDYQKAFHINAGAAVREVVRLVAADIRRNTAGVLKNCDKHLRINDRDLTAHARRGVALVLLGREAEAATHFAALKAALPEMEKVFTLLRRTARERARR